MPRPTALITGASSGIGEGFARRLAADYDLLLVARNADRLNHLAAELATLHPGGRFKAHAADLTKTRQLQSVIDLVRERDAEVDLLVNNAGFGYHGPFAEAQPSEVVGQVQLNCTALVHLTSSFLPRMLQRGNGAVVNLASTSAFQPVPTMTVYAATKAFVLSFTEALHVETRGSGVKVLALCPGATETGFFAASGKGKDYLTSGRQTPDEVVTTALKALQGHRAVVVSGLLNKVSVNGYRIFPRSWIARGAGWLVRTREPQEAGASPAVGPPASGVQEGTFAGPPPANS